ncbi:MAG: hypothetical protein JNG90_09330 [Planctomycetaceae bacterium]|nr:hypothetical protein [Planctomycetaceae bacterium]
MADFRTRKTGTWRGAWVVALLLGGAALAGGQPPPDNTDAQFLAGLRNRRLYRLAQVHCRQRLQATDLGDAERADLTIELARALAAEALELPSTPSDAAWQQAAAVTADFVSRNPHSPRRLLVELQGALVRLAHGEVLREQAAAAGGEDSHYAQARSELRAAIAALRDLRDRVAQELRGAPATSPDGTRLTAAELASTGDHLERQLARASRLQAGSYPPGSADAVDSLNQATVLLRELLERETSAEVRDESRLELAGAWRELAEFDAAREELARLEATQPAPAIALRARAERALLALARGAPSAALEVLAAGRELQGTIAPELDAAFLQTYLALAADAHRQQRGGEADEYQRRADAVLVEIERAHGAAWARRAERLASRNAPAGGPAAGIELLVRAAERLHAAGQADEALAMYDRATEAALQGGDTRRAFELEFVAATIEHERQELTAASRRYRQAARRDPASPRAAEAHLLAAHDALEAAKIVEPLSTTHYRELLEEHLRLWPNGTSRGEALWRLARIETFERRWPEAIAAYRAVAPSDPRFPDAIAAAAEIAPRWAAQERAAGRDPSSRLASLAQELEALLPAAPGGEVAPLAAAPRAAALAAAKLWLESGRNPYERVEALAARVLVDPQLPAETEARALSLLVVALAGQGETEAAEQHLQQMAAAGASDVLAVLESLWGIQQTANNEQRRTLAPLESRTIELVRARAPQLPAPQQQRFRRLEARFLASAGNRPQALAAYEALLRDAPRDGDLREEYATLLAAGNDDPARAGALHAWRDIERHSEPGTPRWFRAKYEIALAHHRAGDDAQAAKIIALTKVLHPELGGAELRDKFARLEAELQAPRAAPPP